MSTPDTFGWDTVFAVRVAQLNAAIAGRGTSPVAFQDTIDDLHSVAGTFGPWAVTTGTGDLVTISAPLATCTVTIDGVGTTVGGATANVEVRLTYIPQDQPAQGVSLQRGKLDAGTNKLVIATAPGPGGAAVQKVDISYSGSKPDAIAGIVVRAGLSAWFAANLGSFAHVFATLDIDRTADHDAFQWLQPHDGGYAYAVDPGGDIFGILSMTGTRVAGTKPWQMASGLIPSGADAGLLIAPPRLLEEVVVPCLKAAFVGLQDTDVALSADGCSIVLQNAVTLAHQVTKGYGYDPILDTLEVRLQADTMVVDARTHASITPGIWSYGRHRVVYKATLSEDAKGQHIGFVQDSDSDAISDHWTHLDPGYQIADYVVMAAAFVATIVLSIATDGAAAILIGMGIGLAQGALMVTPSIIALSGEDDAPAIDLMVADATGSVTWSDSTDFRLTGVALGGGLLLSGNLVAKGG